MSRSKPNRRSRGKGAVAPLPKSPQVRATAIQIHQQSAFSGPIPPPEFLREYDAIMPGLADRIVKMAEKQGDHRHGLETRAVNAEIERGKLGMISGFLVALLGISIGGVLIYHDKLLTGSIFAGGTLVALVGTFVFGTYQRKSERLAKAKILAEAVTG